MCLKRILNPEERRADQIKAYKRQSRRTKKSRTKETVKPMAKPTVKQWIEIIKLISTFIIGVLTTLTVQSCTMSMSIFKNNNGGNQQTEQSTKVDSTTINVKPIK